MSDLHSITLESSSDPHFKINNREYLLKKATYNIIILSQDIEVIDSYNVNHLNNLLCLEVP